MILTIDIGNTQIKMGIFKDSELIIYKSFNEYQDFEKTIRTQMAMNNVMERVLINKGDNDYCTEKVCISSVVPELTKKLNLTMTRYYSV